MRSRVWAVAATAPTRGAAVYIVQLSAHAKNDSKEECQKLKDAGSGEVSAVSFWIPPESSWIT